MRRIMKIPVLFVVLMFGFLHSISLADHKIAEDGNEVLVEARYLTNNQIKNKFIRGWNRDKAMDERLTAAEESIATLQENQEAIQVSLKVKCGKLDLLLDTGVTATAQDCCMTDFFVICLARTIVESAGYNFGDSPGNCLVCPTDVYNPNAK